MSKPCRERVYVKVTSAFDATGYMAPKSITWADGRTFQIDQIRDFRPGSLIGASSGSICYTIVIGGKEKRLFFERCEAGSRVGRWFVETMAAT